MNPDKPISSAVSDDKDKPDATKPALLPKPAVGTDKPKKPIADPVRKISAESASASSKATSCGGLTRSKDSSAARKLKHKMIEGYVFLHHAIEYILKTDPDAMSIIAELLKVEAAVRVQIDDDVLKHAKITFGNISEGLVTIRKKCPEDPLTPTVSESFFCEAFLPSHSSSLAPTRAPSLETDSPTEDRSITSGDVSGDSSNRPSRSETPLSSDGRSRSHSVEQSDTPPDKRHRSASPHRKPTGYPFKEKEKKIDFKGQSPSLSAGSTKSSKTDAATSEGSALPKSSDDGRQRTLSSSEVSDKPSPSDPTPPSGPTSPGDSK